MEVVVTTYKQLFLIRKLYTGLEVSGEYGICLSFLTFKQLNREIQFSKFNLPIYPTFLPLLVLLDIYIIVYREN